MDRQRNQYIHKISSSLNAGNIPLAETLALDALRIYKREYVFISLLGLVKTRQAKWPEAIKLFQKAAKLEPKNWEALRNLANAYKAAGDANAAHQHLIRALMINPNAADLRVSMAQILVQKSEYAKALNQLEMALRLRPDYPEAYFMLLEICERTNDLEQLRKAISTNESVTRVHPVTRLFKGILAARDGDEKEAASILEQVDFSKYNPDVVVTYQRMKNSALAMLNDKAGNVDTAFAQFTKAKQFNRALPQNAGADAGEFHRQIARRQAYFSGQGPKARADMKTDEQAPVFFVGFPRSGTTLLDTFLRGHPDVQVQEEKPATKEMIAALEASGANGIDAPGVHDRSVLKKARRAYFSAMPGVETGGVMVDKAPFNLVYAGEILRVFPDAKFVFSLRDPADVVLSCFMQTFKLSHSMAALESPLEAAKTYDLALGLWRSIENSLSPRVCYLKYEDLVSDPETTLRGVVNFMNLPWNSAVLRHTETAKAREHIGTPSYTQVVKPLYSSSVSRWKKYAGLMPEALEVIQPWRKHFGYSD